MANLVQYRGLSAHHERYALTLQSTKNSTRTALISLTIAVAMVVLAFVVPFIGAKIFLGIFSVLPAVNALIFVKLGFDALKDKKNLEQGYTGQLGEDLPPSLQEIVRAIKQSDFDVDLFPLMKDANAPFLTPLLI